MQDYSKYKNGVSQELGSLGTTNPLRGAGDDRMLTAEYCTSNYFVYNNQRGSQVLT